MDFSCIHFYFHHHRALQQPLASHDVEVGISKLKQQSIAAASKSNIFYEEDIHLSIEAEELAARYFPLFPPLM
jgi:hypothetical protein